MVKIAVLGAGSWGTALALVLNDNGHEVRLWSFEQQQITDLVTLGENKRFLPGITLPPSLLDGATASLAQACADVGAVVMAVPTAAMRTVAEQLLPYLPTSAVVISVSKGLELGTGLRMSELLHDVLGAERPVAVLSGPSHAEEVGRRLPTTVVVAAANEVTAESVLQLFNNSAYFRVYLNHDLVGVELCGALKNIIAIACGIADGIGLGDNTQAALLTRGLWEICRLGRALGAEERTFFGLAGMGDLAVTCGSRHSRNRRLGQMLGQGQALEQAVASLGMVAEGVLVTKAAVELAATYQIEMPITQAMYDIMYRNKPVVEVLPQLMARATKHEAF